MFNANSSCQKQNDRELNVNQRGPKIEAFRRLEDPTFTNLILLVYLKGSFVSTFLNRILSRNHRWVGSIAGRLNFTASLYFVLVQI